MANETQTVRIIVDASGAKRELASYSADATRAGERTDASLKRLAKTIEEVQVKTDPVFRAMRTQQIEVERATRAAADAVKYFGASQADANAIVQRTRDHYGALVTNARNAATASSTLGRAMSGVQGQLVALSAGAGPVGTFLAGLGPWGIAGAAGIGAAGVALNAAAEAANRFAADMLKLRDAAATVDLTTAELQALNDQAAKFGLTEDKVTGALQRFTAELDATRRGQGALYEILQRIDPALANEIAMTRDTASALNVLAKAYEVAGTSRQKLDRIIGGRNGGSIGLLFQEVGKGGGLGETTDVFRKSGDAIQTELIDRIARLKAEVEDMTQDAQRNFASLFTAEYMQQLHRNAELWLEISRAMKNAADQKARLAADPVLSRGLMDVEGMMPPGYDQSGTFDGRFSASNGSLRPGPSVPLPLARPTAVFDRAAAELELNTLREKNSLLGSAATAVEQLTIKEKELGLALRDNKISQEEYNRALQGARLDTTIQQESARLALIGVALTMVAVVARQAANHNEKDKNDGGEYCSICQEQGSIRGYGRRELQPRRGGRRLWRQNTERSTLARSISRNRHDSSRPADRIAA